jgi:hypothetical protein
MKFYYFAQGIKIAAIMYELRGRTKLCGTVQQLSEEPYIIG